MAGNFPELGLNEVKVAHMVAMGEHAGLYLSELRKAKRWTQEEFGNAMNVERSTVGNWEKNLNFPGGEKLKKALILLNVDTRIIHKYLGTAVREETAEGLLRQAVDMSVTAVTLAEMMLLLKDQDNFTINEAAFKYTEPKVFAALALKAMGGQPDAVKVFRAWGADLENERRLRANRAQKTGAATPAEVGSWAVGDGVYVKKDAVVEKAEVSE